MHSSPYGMFSLHASTKPITHEHTHTQIEQPKIPIIIHSHRPKQQPSCESGRASKNYLHEANSIVNLFRFAKINAKNLLHKISVVQNKRHHVCTCAFERFIERTSIRYSSTEQQQRICSIELLHYFL